MTWIDRIATDLTNVPVDQGELIEQVNGIYCKLWILSVFNDYS